MSSKKRGITHIPASDGLRAVAVIAVMLYHLGFPWIPGGFLGVDLFFVISGYVITRLLLDSIQRDGVQRIAGCCALKIAVVQRGRLLFPGRLPLVASVLTWQLHWFAPVLHVATLF